MFDRSKARLAAAGAALCLAAPLAHALNPIITDVYTADPTALVDGNRVYLYVGRDEAAAGATDYNMNEWRIYSSCNMVKWKYHSAIRYNIFSWARGHAWASHIIKRGSKYYFYATVDHKTIPGHAIGVAVSDSPTGPFRDALGRALITNPMTKQTDIPWDDIDPAVFIDTNGQAYLYWGNTFLKYAKLKSNMIELDGGIGTFNINLFTEAPWVHKRGSTYYLSYAHNFPEDIAYSTGPSPTGPWTYRGVIMNVNSNVRTIHQAPIDFNGKSYMFYHSARLPGGGEYRRAVAVDEMKYNADGTIKPVAKTATGPAANPTPGCVD
jgi:arabinoxylan arabinofuranohydrolase